MQGLQLDRLLKPAALVFVALFISIPVKELRYVPIYDALTIKAHKNSPPHVAFEELLADNKDIQIWESIDNPPLIHSLQSGDSVQPLFGTKSLSLSELVISKDEVLISKTTEVVPDATYENRHLANIQASAFNPPVPREEEVSDNKVLDNLNRRQENRILAARERGVDIENLIKETLASDPAPNSDVDYGVSQYQVVGNKSIKGLVEISDGLAVTNENKILVRRFSDGVYKEMGQVSVKDGTYSIDIEDLSGAVIAQLRDNQGRVLGEGRVRLGNLAMNKFAKSFTGPKINIKPSSNMSAAISSYYSEKTEQNSPPSTVASLFRGAKDLTPAKGAVIAMDDVSRGSASILRASAPDHLQTITLMGTDQETKAQLFPSSMIGALYNIVAEDRGLGNVEEYRVIWGQVTTDDKATADAEVVLESFPALTAVYFNEFNIPDSNLKATSKNGLYAFVNVPEGFHSLVVLQKDKVVGYQNTNVENDSVSLAHIELGKEKFNVPLKVYDAFSGQGLGAKIDMQSLEESIAVVGGTVVSLPAVNRIGYIRALPEESDYVSARYLYNDTDISINIPLVKWDWLVRIKEYLKIQDLPSAGAVVGFVPSENFEVYLAGYDNFPTSNIVYFDSEGKILSDGKGIKGGGFIIYNVPEDTHEVVVYGVDSHKINSRVVPVDRGSLAVLTYLNQ